MTAAPCGATVDIRLRGESVGLDDPIVPRQDVAIWQGGFDETAVQPQSGMPIQVMGWTLLLGACPQRLLFT